MGSFFCYDVLWLVVNLWGYFIWNYEVVWVIGYVFGSYYILISWLILILEVLFDCRCDDDYF